MPATITWSLYLVKSNVKLNKLGRFKSTTMFLLWISYFNNSLKREALLQEAQVSRTYNKQYNVSSFTTCSHFVELKLFIYLYHNVYYMFNLSLPLQYHYMLCELTLIRIELYCLDHNRNAAIRSSTTNYQVEGSQPIKSNRIQWATWDTK